MKSQSWLVPPGVIVFACFMLVRSVLSDEPPADLDNKQAAAAKKGVSPPGESVPRVSLDVARDRAKLLHNVYASTLDVIHRRYFHGDRAVVPARAMEDVFSDLQDEYGIEARWISVIPKAMNIDHEPETEFEKKAAAKIKLGKRDIESVEAGYYRRAIAIPLSGGCINCHSGLFGQSTQKPFAGLVISVPMSSPKEPTDHADTRR